MDRSSTVELPAGLQVVALSYNDAMALNVMKQCEKASDRLQKSVADPGFPRGGGAPTPQGGGATYDFTKFPQKLHEIERIWMPGGGGGGGRGEGARPSHSPKSAHEN